MTLYKWAPLSWGMINYLFRVRGRLQPGPGNESLFGKTILVANSQFVPVLWPLRKFFQVRSACFWPTRDGKWRLQAQAWPRLKLRAGQELAQHCVLRGKKGGSGLLGYSDLRVDGSTNGGGVPFTIAKRRLSIVY